VEFDPDEGLNTFQEDIYEHEIRLPFTAWGHHEAYWADVVCIYQFCCLVCDVQFSAMSFCNSAHVDNCLPFIDLFVGVFLNSKDRSDLCTRVVNIMLCSVHLQRGDKLTGRDDKPITRDEMQVSDGWKWSTQWQVDMNGAVDEEGEGVKYCS